MQTLQHPFIQNKQKNMKMFCDKISSTRAFRWYITHASSTCIVYSVHIELLAFKFLVVH